ncbi:MAG: hypothetical protein ACOY5C_04905 [Pseudomonadota bacterium]
MTVQVELWQLISLLITIAGSLAGFGKLLLSQFEKRLSERFEAMQLSLNRQAEEEQKAAAQLAALEREFLQFRADLPLHYVRREDYVRGQSVLEAKLDALFSEVKMVQIKGAKNG